MILGTVVGNVVATRKMEQLTGYKFLLVRPEYGDRDKLLVAGDNTLSAGIGEMVLVTTDQTTQYALDKEVPIDALIVGIVDAPPTIQK